MNNVALGQYMPLDSVVHKMDPRSKIMIMLFLMVAIFIPAGALGYAIIGAFILFSLYLSFFLAVYCVSGSCLFLPF